jgi:hypothetical protein
MSTTIKLLCMTLALLYSTTARSSATSPVFEYDWVGGQPGFSGQIFLNAPSSSLAADGGSDADVLPGSFVATPLGTFSLLNHGLDTAFDPPGNAMIWDQTHVLYMNLFFDPVTPINNPAFGSPAIGNALANVFYPPNNAVEVGSLAGGFSTAYFEDDFAGQWLAVPEPPPAVLLGVFGVMAGIRRWRNPTAVSG